MKKYRNKLIKILPVILGALAGFLYYSFIGCYSGSCAITSNPVISTFYGAAIGFVFTDFKTSKRKGENNEN
jgi:hypothetical protein